MINNPHKNISGNGSSDNHNLYCVGREEFIRFGYHIMIKWASIMCIFVNMVVVCVLAMMKRTQTNLQLIVLAISDTFISISLLWSICIGYIWNPCSQEFKRQWSPAKFLWGSINDVNKSITFYIVILRAASVSTINIAIKSKTKTKRKALLELFITTFFGWLVHFIVSGVLLHYQLSVRLNYTMHFV